MSQHVWGVAFVLATGLACEGQPWCDLAALVDDAAATGARDVASRPWTTTPRCRAPLAQALMDGVPFVGTVQYTARDRSLSARGFVGDGEGITVFDAAFSSCGDQGCRGAVREVVCGNARPDDTSSRILCDPPEEGCGELVCGFGLACGEE